MAEINAPELTYMVDEVGGLLASRQSERALSVVESMLALWPERGEGYFCLALVSKQLGLLGDAIAAAEKAADMDPEVREHAVLLEGLYGEAGRLNDALFYSKLATSLEKNAALDAMIPGSISSFLAAVHTEKVGHGNYVQALLAFNRRKFDEAVIHCQRELKVDTTNPDVFSLLGNALLKQGDAQQAIIAFQGALKLAPEGNPVNAVGLAEALARLGQVDEAVRALSEIPEGDDVDVAILARAISILSLRPGREDEVRSLIERVHRLPMPKYGERFPATRSSDGIVRIGLVSDRFYDCLEGQAVKTLVSGLNRQHFAIHLYSQNVVGDSVTHDLKNKADSWREIHEIDDKTLSLIIQRDGIDVLLDMCGYGENGRVSLFGAEPAVTRASWLSPHVCLPVRGCATVMAPGEVSSDVARGVGDGVSVEPIDGPALPLMSPMGFEEPMRRVVGEQLVIGTRFSLETLTSDAVDAWRGILDAVPSARLLLGFPSVSALAARDQLNETLAAEGLAERVSWFEPEQSQGRLGEFFNALDVFVGHPGEHLMADIRNSLWMGVPCLLPWTDGCHGGAGASLLAEAGHAGWVVPNTEGLVAMVADICSRAGTSTDERARRRAEIAGAKADSEHRFVAAFEKSINRIFASGVVKDGGDAQ